MGSVAAVEVLEPWWSERVSEARFTVHFGNDPRGFEPNSSPEPAGALEQKNSRDR